MALCELQLRSLTTAISRRSGCVAGMPQTAQQWRHWSPATCCQQAQRATLTKARLTLCCVAAGAAAVPPAAVLRSARHSAPGRRRRFEAPACVPPCCCPTLQRMLRHGSPQCLSRRWLCTPAVIKNGMPRRMIKIKISRSMMVSRESRAATHWQDACCLTILRRTFVYALL